MTTVVLQEGSQVPVAANQFQQPVPAALPPPYIQPGQQQPMQYVVAAPQPNVQYPAQPVQYVYMPQQPPVCSLSQYRYCIPQFIIGSSCFTGST